MASLKSVAGWDHEADVVVVGAGLAGCTTAIQAKQADPSLEVLLLDKLTTEMHGGASRCAAGYINCPPPEAVRDVMDYQRALNLPFSIPETVLEAWATAICHNQPWISEVAQSVGHEFAIVNEKAPDFPQFKGSEHFRPLWSIGPEGNQAVWTAFRERVRQDGTEVLTDTAGYELVQDPDTLEVFGVLARRGDGREVAIKARRGVALTLGGMAANMDMLREYRGYDAMWSMGTPANTGDGVKMLQAAGADLWHVTTHAGGIAPGIPVEGFSSVFMRTHMEGASWIDIGADDQRFYDDGADYEASHFKEYRNGHWRDIRLTEVLPIHMIFDQATFDAQPLAIDWVGWNAVALGYRWSQDNSVELEKGWITRADTIEELAELIGRDPASVRATVDRFNGFCADGRDPDFGRAPERLAPIQQGPFYALEIVPAVPGTTGGGRRDEKARVISQKGTPIPRLYEAGELGSTFCNLYQNGSLLTEGIAFGRIAGAELAGLAPVQPAA
jgi:succinate dehydrogenase/fumarate reductase flavoprotein subunit